jgi:uncharacterized membrane protein HdeD (DUF308 family)
MPKKRKPNQVSKTKRDEKLQEKAKLEAATPEEEHVDKTSVTFLAIMGILGLVLIITGIVSIVLSSLEIGVGLIIAGVVVYIVFYVMEKRLKLI